LDYSDSKRYIFLCLYSPFLHQQFRPYFQYWLENFILFTNSSKRRLSNTFCQGWLHGLSLRPVSFFSEHIGFLPIMLADKVRRLVGHVRPFIPSFVRLFFETSFEPTGLELAFWTRIFEWSGGVIVRTLDLRFKRSRVRISAVPLSGNNPGQVVHTRVPLSSSADYLVPVKGRWCPAAGKVTVGLASHWPSVTDFSGLSTYGLMAQEREMSTTPTLIMGYGTPFPFLWVMTMAQRRSYM